MLKVGITGQAGFVGTHLYNYLGLHEEIQRVPFQDEYFQDSQQLQKFVQSCDAIVHLAAMNRHNDPAVIYDTNIHLVKQLIAACEATHSTPHILFSSSTQEERDNPYGNSKREGRRLLTEWAERSGATFTGCVIPNVFGPFGHPYYNSVVATFCHQLTHGETSRIEQDGEIKLIYVGELVEHFYRKIVTKQDGTAGVEAFAVPHTGMIKVSALLEKLTEYQHDYFGKGIIPSLDDPFERNLFNTFLCYIDHDTFFPFRLQQHTDERGSFVETVKLHSGGQVSFSTTVPGITRGNHYHTRKAERFAVIKGRARIDLRRIGTNEVKSFVLDGREPAFVDMPVWTTHNITNIGKEELFTLFWINEHFDAHDQDTYYEAV